MAAPRDADLPVNTYHRYTIAYAGTVAALAGTAIGFSRLPVTDFVTAVFGILESDASPGQDVTIAVAGICQMIAGAALTTGSAITIDSSSRAVFGSPGQQNFGRALTAATAAGQKIQVLITREGTA